MKRIVTVKTASKVPGPNGAVATGGGASYEEYNRNPFHSTERRILNASIDAVAVGLGNTGAAMAVGAGVGAVAGTVFSVGNPVATAVLTGVGAMGGGVGFDNIYYEHLHDGVIKDLKDWAYASLGETSGN